MSKGNLFLGMGRGKLGDIVFTRTGGEQVARPRNRHPRNPQTPAQMFQRGSLATVSEMYIRGIRNFFKYAFTSKSAAQSEYNKFCQVNIGRVPCNSRENLRASAPVIGNFIMTQGSLTRVPIEPTLSAFILRCEAFDKQWGSATVADLSQAFMDSFGYLEGDIITYLDIYSGATPAPDLATAIKMGGLTNIAGITTWKIKQFRIDTTDERLASSLGIFSDESEPGTLILKLQGQYTRFEVEGVTMVVSRNVKGGVLVSDSLMLCNPATQKAIEIGMSDEWKEAVARFWVPDSSGNTDPVNILQGSLSIPVEVPLPTNFIVGASPTLPASTDRIRLDMSYALGNEAGHIGQTLGLMNIDGTSTPIKVSDVGSSVGLTAGAYTASWGRGNRYIEFSASSAHTITSASIIVDYSA